MMKSTLRAFALLVPLFGASAHAAPLVESNVCRQFESAIATWQTLDEQKFHADNGIVIRQLEGRMEQIRDDIDAMVFASRSISGWQATVERVTDVGYDDLYVDVTPTCSLHMKISVAVTRTPATLASLAKLHEGDIVIVTGTFVNPADTKPAAAPEQMSVGPMPEISFGVLATDIRASAAAP